MKKKEKEEVVNMIHFVAFAKVKDKKYAYHFASNDIKMISGKRNEFVNTSHSFIGSSAYSIHVLETNSSDFKSISDMDPYFEGTSVYDDISSFFNKIDSELVFNSTDIASYLYRTFKLNSFALEKVLYYLYAESVKKMKVRFFRASFVAFDMGPVDWDVYKGYKHHKEEFIENDFFDINIVKRNDKRDIFELIDSIVDKYGEYYDNLWRKGYCKDSGKNLTHRFGTPWSIARSSRGRNGKINDEDIINFHDLETI